MTIKNSFLSIIALVTLTVAGITKPMNAQFARTALHYSIFAVPVIKMARDCREMKSAEKYFNEKSQSGSKEKNQQMAATFHTITNVAATGAAGGIVAVELAQRRFIPTALSTFGRAAQFGVVKSVAVVPAALVGTALYSLCYGFCSAPSVRPKNAPTAMESAVDYTNHMAMYRQAMKQKQG